MLKRKIPSIRQPAVSGRLLPRRKVIDFPAFKTANLSPILRSNILYESRAVLSDWQKFQRALAARIGKLVNITLKELKLLMVLTASALLVFFSPAGSSYTSGKNSLNQNNLRSEKIANTEVKTNLESREGPEFKWPLATQISQNYSKYHPAIDITAQLNTTVKPVAPGVVEKTFTDIYGRGKTIIIRHSDGFKSLYAHLNKTLVKEQEEVNSSKAIGTVGLTGRTSGAHLHLEIEEYSKDVNPLKVLP